MDPRAVSDLGKGWNEFLTWKTEGKHAGSSNHGRSSGGGRRERNRTPTQEELAALVGLLSFVHQHCEVHMRISSSLQAAAAARSASPAASSASQESRSAPLEHGSARPSNSRESTPTALIQEKYYMVKNLRVSAAVLCGCHVDTDTMRIHCCCSHSNSL